MITLSGPQLNWLLDVMTRWVISCLNGYIIPVFYRVFYRHMGKMPHMPFVLYQLPDGIDALKSLVAEQVARNKKRKAGK